MKFGILPYLFLATIVLIVGAVAWLAFTDVPVQQQEIIVNVPIGGAS